MQFNLNVQHYRRKDDAKQLGLARSATWHVPFGVGMTVNLHRSWCAQRQINSIEKPH
jgi:hypothetical protein